MKSKRTDRRGHWTPGKPRSTLSAAQVATVLRKLNRALQDQSMLKLAKVLEMSDTQVGRIVRGHNLPSQATYERVTARL